MLDWTEVDTVFLDMDGTLLDLHFDNHFWLQHVPLRYSQKQGISIDAAKDLLFPRMRALHGLLDWYCTDFWSKELGLPIIALKRETSDLIQLRPQAERLLAALQASNKRSVLFTNAHPDTVGLKMEMTGIAHYFDAIITSHEIGVAKEDSDAWRNLGKVEIFDPKRSLFIDDNFNVLRCAKDHGIAIQLGITQPDLSGPKISSDEFNLIDDFSQLLPL